jgi:ABC-type dipeptide/oligopeptide/nickel transport system ATPase component
MSSKLIAIVGPSGTGKSTSIKTLNPKETFIINVARKELPFKGAEKLYNVESKNYMEVDDLAQITGLLGTISEKAPHIKNIVMDDAIYSMSFLMMKKANEVGFSKFTNLAKDVTTLLTTARKLRNDLKVFYITHSENIEDEGKIVGQKIKTIGKMLDNQIVLEGLFTIALYTHVGEDKDDNATYHFVTNRWRNYPAKSPMGMFETTLIPNDLQEVCTTIDTYYTEEEPVKETKTKK